MVPLVRRGTVGGNWVRGGSNQVMFVTYAISYLG
jgi:hypothetical protein